MRISPLAFTLSVAVSLMLASPPAKSQEPTSSPRRAASAPEPMWPVGWPRGDRPPLYPDEPTEERYSTAMMTTGIVLLPVSHLAFNLSTYVWLSGAMSECGCMQGAVCDCGSRPARIGAGLMVGSIFALAAGIVLTSVGARSVPRESVGQSPLVPKLSCGRSGAAFGWVF